MQTSGHGGAAGTVGVGSTGGNAGAGVDAAAGDGSGGSNSGGASGSDPTDDASICAEAACDGIECGVSPFCQRHCGTCPSMEECVDGQCMTEDCGQLMLTLETYASCAIDVVAEQELDGEGFIDAEGRQQRVLALDRWGSGHVIAWCDSSTLAALITELNVRHYLGRSDVARVASFGDDFMCNPMSVSSSPLPSHITYLGLGLPAEYRDDPGALAADWDAIIYCGYRAEWDDAWVPTLQAFVVEHERGLLVSLDYAGLDVTSSDFAHANALIEPTGMTFLEVLNYAATAAVAVDGNQCVPDLVVY